jgi:hypothetical protein
MREGGAGRGFALANLQTEAPHDLTWAGDRAKGAAIVFVEYILMDTFARGGVGSQLVDLLVNQVREHVDGQRPCLVFCDVVSNDDVAVAFWKSYGATLEEHPHLPTHYRGCLLAHKRVEQDPILVSAGMPFQGQREPANARTSAVPVFGVLCFVVFCYVSPSPFSATWI